MKTIRTSSGMGMGYGPHLKRSAVQDRILFANRIPCIFRNRTGGQERLNRAITGTEVTRRILLNQVPSRNPVQLKADFEALLNSGNILVKPAIREALTQVSTELGVKAELDKAIYIFGLKLAKMLKQPTMPGKSVITRLMEDLEGNGMFAGSEEFGEIKVMATKILEKMMTQAVFFGVSFSTTQEIRSYLKPVEYAEPITFEVPKPTRRNRVAEVFGAVGSMIASLAD